MPTPSRQLLSRTIYDTDGVTVNWDFSFSGGYLDRGHVKAYVDLPTGERTELTVTAGMFTGPYQLAITPAILSGRTLTIYRDTPKDLPLVDFTDGSGFSEVSLDIMAKQAVFVSAESVDTLNTSSNYEAAVAADAAQVSQLAAAASAASAAVSANSAAASAASINPASFATAAQGAKADTAIQPAGFTVTAINGATTLGRNLMAVVDAAAARVLLGLSTFGSSIVQAADAAVARVLLGAAASGANNDITSLTALTAISLPDNSVTTPDIANGAVTPAKLSGLTVTQANQNTLPGPGVLMTYTHGLGAVPASAELEVVCLTAELGYAVGDVVTGACSNSGGTYYSPLAIKKNATTVNSVATNAWGIGHATTGVMTNPTLANWAWRFKVRVA